MLGDSRAVIICIDGIVVSPPEPTSICSARARVDNMVAAIALTHCIVAWHTNSASKISSLFLFLLASVLSGPVGEKSNVST